MTAPIQGFTITIQSDGTGLLSAPDFNTEGHTWALRDVKVSLSEIHQVADILGIGAFVQARLEEELQRAESSVTRIDQWILTAKADRARAATLRKALGK